MITLGRRSTTLLAMFATGTITYVFFYLYFKNANIVFGPDVEDILAPLFFDISRSIHRHGLLAGMYNPGQVAGLSLWNTPYFHPLYPFYFNWLGSDASIFDTIARLRVVDLLHLSFYAAGTYLLCCSIGIRHWLALVIGVASPWLPAVHSLLNWPQILASFAWIPWILASQLIIYRNPSRFTKFTAILALAVTFSLLVYAQPAQNMILAIVGSAIIWLTMAARSIRTTDPGNKADFRQATISLAIAGFISAALCGGYLVEVTLYLSKSIRWVGSHGAIVGMQKMPLSALREYSLHWRDIVGLVVYGRGNPTVPGNLFVGAPLILAALLTYVTKKHDRAINPLAVSALAAMVFCFGFFAPVLQWLPVANKVRELSWWSCYVAAAGLPIGAYGLQQLLALPSSQGERRTISDADRRLAVIAISASLAVMAVLYLLAPQINAFDVIATYIGLGLLLSNFIYPVVRGRFRQITAAITVILAAAIPIPTYTKYLFKAPLLMDVGHVKRREDATQIASLIADGDRYRFAVSPKFSDYKNLTVALSNLGLRGIRGDLSPQEYDKFRLLFFPSAVVSDLYGVKYEVVQDNERAPGDLHAEGDIFLHVNDRALPRVFFVQGGVKVVNSPVDALLAVSGDSPLPFFVASRDVSKQASFAPYTTGPATISFPSVTKNNSVRVSATLASARGGLLVLNEDPAGRWRATVDGQRAVPIPINGFQTAFLITGPGYHQVEIERPTHLF